MLLALVIVEVWIGRVPDFDDPQDAVFSISDDRSVSSGGFNARNDLRRRRSYITFAPPPINKGAEKVRACIRKPAVADPTAQNMLRERFVIPLAYVRSPGLTRAA